MFSTPRPPCSFWQKGPNDVSNTGWGLELKPRDMLVFGELFLNEGNFGGHEIVPSNWIDSSRPGVGPIAANSTLTYGYQWWGLTDASTVVGNLSVNDMYFASGYGGQLIIVVPHLDIVVVMTAGNFDDSLRNIYVMRDYVFPAVTN